MLIAKNISEIRNFVKLAKQKNQQIAFIPTMGALHQGHLSLFEQAKSLTPIQIASIFINQTQFNNPSDFELYPRQIESDLELLKSHKVSSVFIPSNHEIYPQDFSTKIIPTQLVNCLCGKYRTGHFEGVALILAKFFNLIEPDFVLMGEKDFQQLAVVKKLVKDLNFSLEIIGCETSREQNGLARSSRNQCLSESGKQKAAKIFQILQEIQEFWQENRGFEASLKDLRSKSSSQFDRQKLKEFLREKESELISVGFSKIEYLEIRTEEGLNLIEDFNFDEPARIFIAAYLEQVRLIDNLALN